MKTKDCLGTRIHNPLNIRYSIRNNWIGQTSHLRGFCVFTEYVYGFRAAYRTIRSYQRRGITTLSRIIETFAPRREHDTTTYIKIVCNRTGLRPDFIIDTQSGTLLLLIAAMAFVETNTEITTDELHVMYIQNKRSWDY